MEKIVFYSWQSDLPNSTNRGFIQEVLETTAAGIAADKTIAVQPVIDRDTKGVAGTPDIAATIFAKIAAADIFVADVSIIGVVGERPTPNPNVMMELGYAVKALGWERVLLVFNEASGAIDDLPFDLRGRRLAHYELVKGATKAEARKSLGGQLDAGLRAALSKLPASEPGALVATVNAIEQFRPNRVLIVRRHLAAILQELEALQPTKPIEGGSVEDLLTGFAKAQEPIAEFTRIVNAIAAMNDRDLALEVHRWFGLLLVHYDLPRSVSGSYTDADFDFFKIVGHELFTTLIATLLAERRWDVLQAVLEEPIPVAYLRQTGGPGTLDWDSLSEHSALLGRENQRRSRISVHGDLLKERHTTGGLAAVMPFNQFVAADYFLFLRGELPPKDYSKDGWFKWRPWSVLGMEHTPAFIHEAERAKNAAPLAKTLGVSSVDELRNRMLERGFGVARMFSGAFWRSSLNRKDFEKIGTSG